jgi:uncharacterized protein YbaP (TraB family)
LIATEERVVKIPAAVLHQPTVIMMEDGHKITRKSVLPSTMISQMPNLQRRTSTVLDTISAVPPAMIAVCLVLIEPILGRADFAAKLRLDGAIFRQERCGSELRQLAALDHEGRVAPSEKQE